MTNEQIEGFIQKNQSRGSLFEIRFKTRNAIRGLFIRTNDYDELSRKNLWRIVRDTHVDEYKKTNDESLARIFNGSEFTKLESVTGVNR